MVREQRGGPAVRGQLQQFPGAAADQRLVEVRLDLKAGVGFETGLAQGLPQPRRRSWTYGWSSGPRMLAILRCPSSSRWRPSSRPPAAAAATASGIATQMVTSFVTSRPMV